MAEKESDRTQEQPQKALLEISTAKLKAESSSASNMVFPHSKYPCGEGSTLHLSATERKSGLNCFDGRFKGKLNPGLAMKRPYSGDDIHSLPGDKRNCLESLRFVKEEISQADFQMALIKRSIAKRKEWIYRQVLQNLGLASPYDSNHSQPENMGHNRVNEMEEQCQQSKTQTRGYSNTNTPDGSQGRSVSNVSSVPLGQQGRVDEQVKRPRSAPHSSCSGFSSDHRYKVHDEDGNCYIDEDDFKSFYRPKGSPLPSPIGNIPNGETKDFNTCDTTSVPKRSLNFTFHGSNGGLAIDHTRMPRITAIHSVGGIKGRRREHEAHPRQHAEAKLTGSTYRETIKRDETGRQKITTKEDTKWWPPSPESMPEDVMSRDGGEGLLKVMTPDDLEAYGLSKQVASDVPATEPEDYDVIVTHVKLAPNDKKNVSGKSAMGPKLVSEMPALQLDAYGKPSNYKEILLHFISERTSSSLANIQSVAERPRRKLSMDQLCNKLLYTRQRLEREQQKCKRKLLSSLEVVLIKKIRRLEQETGESAPDGIVLEGSVRDMQKEVTEEAENVAVSSKGSSSDIVAMMEDLTAESGDDESARGYHRRVSTIRGYDSS